MVKNKSKFKNKSNYHKHNNIHNKKNPIRNIPSSNLKTEKKDNFQDNQNKKVLEKYDIDSEGAKGKVEIKRENLDLIYSLEIPSIKDEHLKILEEIKNQLIAMTTVSMKEMVDPSLFSNVKERFRKEAGQLVNIKFPRADNQTKELYIGTLLQEMLGLGNIEYLINDINLEEIVIHSSKEPIRVYNKKYGWLKTTLKMKDEEEIINYSNIIARRVGKQITVLSPLLDAHLVTGDRINAVLYPIDTHGNTITIRKFARDPFTIVDLVKHNTCDVYSAAIIWLAMEFEMNILISGGTGSGKTSFLNACLPFIPPNQRILSIEDTRELMLPEFLYWTPLVTRSPNPEGKGEVTMLDLLINSLRMRPDRIILGEMRKQQEATVLFEAMHTGHSVYATLHADSASETISRLVNPPLNIPGNLLKAVNLNVVMFRDRRKGIRRVFQIAEFEVEGQNAKSNILFRWVPEQDKLIKHADTSRFYEDLSRNTGMGDKEIDSYIEEKKKILEYLVKQDIRSMQEFGKVMNLYYKNKKYLLELIASNQLKSEITRK